MWTGKAQYDGKYSKEFQLLSDKALSHRRTTKSLNTELIRAMFCIEYEWYNNGNMNMNLWNSECLCNAYFRLLAENIPTTKSFISEIQGLKIQECLESIQIEWFADEVKKLYNTLIEIVVEFVITNNIDQVTPKWYLCYWKFRQ